MMLAARSTMNPFPGDALDPASYLGPRLQDPDPVAFLLQPPGSGQPAGTGTDDDHGLGVHHLSRS
jgi:hypothetical protein